MSRRWESLSLDLRCLLLMFMTERVCSHKYVEANKLSIVFANVRISGNRPLSSCRYKFIRESCWCRLLNELQLQLMWSIIRIEGEGGREVQHILFDSCKMPKVFVKLHCKRCDGCGIPPHLRTNIVLWKTVHDLTQSWKIWVLGSFYDRCLWRSCSLVPKAFMCA